MTPLWTAEDAKEATDGKTAGSWSASGVAIDSRALRAGELFIALKGENADGHQFVTDALARGAVAAIVSSRIPDVPPEKLLQVWDVQAGLEDLGRFGRSRFTGRIVALTGSVGKTSTKEMLHLALSVHGENYASPGNFNNHIGTPLNLTNLPPDAKTAVFELGMNHAGEISALTAQVRPHVALITSVDAVHLEFFRSVEEIADAKCEIFEGVEAGGWAILPRDNLHFERLRKQAVAKGVSNILSFGTHELADFRVAAYKATLEGSEITLRIQEKEIRYRIGTIGAHWAVTSASVLACAHALGLDVQKTAKGLSGFREIGGRGSLHRITLPGGAVTLVDDSYNASPAAMRAAFAKLKELRAAGACKGRVVAALGDMRELGASGPALHTALAEDIRSSGIDLVFTAGELMQNLYQALPPALRGESVPQAELITPLLLKNLKEGDLLLIKGSHGSYMYKVAEQLLAEEKIRHAV